MGAAGHLNRRGRKAPLTEDTNAERASAEAGNARIVATSLRVLLGVIWLINAAFQAYAWLLPGEQSAASLLHAYSKPLATAPAWLAPYLTAVIQGIETVGPHVVAGIMVLLDVVIGLSLISGFGVVVFSLLGIAYSLFCWTEPPRGDRRRCAARFLAEFIGNLYCCKHSLLYFHKQLPDPHEARVDA
ncbi:MAG: hypothetical protein P8Y27_16795 [Chromatiaceae bacterium]|jgi:hypothetical protein